MCLHSHVVNLYCIYSPLDATWRPIRHSFEWRTERIIFQGIMTVILVELLVPRKKKLYPTLSYRYVNVQMQFKTYFKSSRIFASGGK